MTKIDMNSDLGESFGRYSLGKDSEIIPLVSSVNIACGYHAGDPDVMAQTVKLAEEAGVGVGAHPGFPDLQGFGRRKMAMKPDEVQHMVTYQVGALLAFTSDKKLQHVKPHGALYNMAAKDHDLAIAICKGIAQVDENIPIYGLANSELISAAKEVGIPYAQEAFGDRNYNADGTLVSRSLPDAVIKEPKKVAERVQKMIENQEIIALDGTKIPLKPDTICVHGDNRAALDIVEELRKTLTAANIEITPFKN